MSSPTADRDPFEVIAESFLVRFRAGERPSVEEYVARHPEQADEIRELLPALVMVEQDLTIEPDRGPISAPRLVTRTGKPRHLGDYRILSEIGRGGMGVVYEAEQISLGRRVALKVLPRHVTGDSMALERFRREAKAAARLHHTNIVPVYEVGRADDVAYYAMQFIQGQGLDQVIDELARQRNPDRKTIKPERPRPTAVGTDSGQSKAALGVVAVSLLSGRFATEGAVPHSEALPAALTSLAAIDDLVQEAPHTPDPALDDPEPAGRGAAPTPLPSALLPGGTSVSSAYLSGRRAPYYRSVAHIGRQAAQGLAYAHASGIVHRDIKPSNLLLDYAGVVWITDFGLAKGEDEGLTDTGDLLGTLRYMAPERFRGEGDARADLYALGLALYELLTLRPAFDSPDRLKLIEQIKNEEPPKPRAVDSRIPRDLETIVLKAIEKDPKARYQSAEAMGEDLRRFLADEPIRARRTTLLEHYARWARHHPAIAVLGAVLTALLMAITIASVVAAAYFRDLERQQRGLVEGKAALAARNQRLAEENEAARAAAERAQNRAETTLVDMQTSRGLLAAERDDPARAVLWFAKAAEASAADPVRRADNLLRARNWARELTVPVRAFSIGTSNRPVRILEFCPGRDLLLVLTDDRLFVRHWRNDQFLPWANDLPKVGAACWSPNGDWLAIGDHSGNVQIRAVHDGKVLHAMTVPGAITALAFSPNGQHLAVAASEVQDWQGLPTVIPWDLKHPRIRARTGKSAVRLWDSRSHGFVPGDWQHPAPIHSLVFNRAGDRLITASLDKKARVFAVPGDPDRAVPLFGPLHHEPRFPWAPVFIDGERELISVSKDWDGKATELTCWDVNTGKPAGPGVVPARPSYVPRVIAGSHGDWFATAGHWGPELWQTEDQGAKSIYLSDHSHYVEDLVASPDGRSLLSASWDRTARLYSAPDGKSLGSPLPHMGNVIRCAFADDNIHLATLADGVVRIWRRSVRVTAKPHSFTSQGIARPSFDGRLIAPGIWHEAAAGFVPIGAAELFVLNSSTGAVAGPTIVVPGQLADSCVCADHRIVAAVSDENGNGWLSLNDVYTGAARSRPLRLPGSPRSVAARPSTPQVAVLCAESELLVFDARSGERVLDWKHEGHAAISRTSRVAYTADGTTLISQCEDALFIHEAETGQLRCPPIRPVLRGGPCRSFALSADSRMLATAVSGQNAAQVWDLATGRALSPPLAHPGDKYGLFCLCFSPDGRYLLTGCKDGQARLWDWRAGTLACPSLKHDEEVFAVVITPDGRFALTGGRDRASKLHVWELTTGRLIAPKVAFPSSIAFLTCSADSSQVIASTTELVSQINLAQLLAPPELTIEDFRLLGELASGERIEQGDESGLTQDEWLQRLKLFNQRHPEYDRPDHTDTTVRRNGGSGRERQG